MKPTKAGMVLVALLTATATISSKELPANELAGHIETVLIGRGSSAVRSGLNIRAVTHETATIDEHHFALQILWDYFVRNHADAVVLDRRANMKEELDTSTAKRLKPDAAAIAQHMNRARKQGKRLAFFTIPGCLGVLRLGPVDLPA